MVHPWHGNIEKETVSNKNYRKTPFTGQHEQVVLMNIKPHQEIGREKHTKSDQFLRIESGCANFIVDGKKFHECAGGAVVIPAGHYHNVINASNKPLKLYTVYSHKEHPAKTLEEVKPKND